MHVYLPKTKLESEGIEVILQDELTSQINPFNSFAIGGVKLLVKEEDFDRAHDLLNEWGYHLDDENTKPNKIIIAFNRFTSYIPVVRKWIIVKRFIFLLTVLMLLIAFVILSFQDL